MTKVLVIATGGELADALQFVLPDAQIETVDLKHGRGAWSRIQPDLVVISGSVEELDFLRKRVGATEPAKILIISQVEVGSCPAISSEVAFVQQPLNYNELINALSQIGVCVNAQGPHADTFENMGVVDGASLEEYLNAIFSQVTGARGNEDGFEMIENRLLKIALEKTGGNQSRAAKLLGITRNTVRKRAQKLNKGPH